MATFQTQLLIAILQKLTDAGFEVLSVGEGCTGGFCVTTSNVGRTYVVDADDTSLILYIKNGNVLSRLGRSTITEFIQDMRYHNTTLYGVLDILQGISEDRVNRLILGVVQRPTDICIETIRGNIFIKNSNGVTAVFPQVQGHARVMFPIDHLVSFIEGL